MRDEIKGKISVLENRISKEEVGSVKYNVYTEAKKELEKKLSQFGLHKECEQVCESCQ